MTDEWGSWVYGWDGVRIGMDLICVAVDVNTDTRITHECRVVSQDDVTFFVEPPMPHRGDWMLIKHKKKKPPALQKLIQMVENMPVRKPQYEDA